MHTSFSEAGIISPVVLSDKEGLVHLRISGDKLLAQYFFPDGPCVLVKTASMVNKIWLRVLDILARGIRNI